MNRIEELLKQIEEINERIQEKDETIAQLGRKISDIHTKRATWRAKAERLIDFNTKKTAELKRLKAERDKYKKALQEIKSLPQAAISVCHEKTLETTVATVGINRHVRHRHE